MITVQLPNQQPAYPPMTQPYQPAYVPTPVPAPVPQTQILLVEQTAGGSMPTMGAAVHQSGNNNLAEAVDAEKLITITACCCTITSCFCQMPECFGCYSKAVLCCLDEECLACKPSSKDTGCCK